MKIQGKTGLNPLRIRAERQKKSFFRNVSEEKSGGFLGLILKSCNNNMIFDEFSGAERENWFDLRSKKFLNTIDTLYYTVFLKGDFTAESKDKKVIYYRNFFERRLAMLKIYESIVLEIPKLPMYFEVIRCYFGSGTYDVCLRRSDYYDILLSRRTSNASTPQILVQLRSKALWMDGVRQTIDNSLEDIRILMEYFGFTIVDVKENRIDYCWHTNYIQNPELYFNPANFAKMRLSRMDDSTFHVKYRGNEDYEIDYVTLGMKASCNVFFRIYLKSKEVVEKGYKAFFLKTWFLNGLINRYDLYCYEYAYEYRNWNYLILGRLAFYYEYGSDKSIKQQCKDILDEKLKLKYDDLKYFADMITPPVTLVINVEYQTMRKFSQSLELPNSTYNYRRYGVYSRLYDIVDNYRYIANYLTLHSVRLVTPEGDENKSRRLNTPFWEALSRARSIDGKNKTADSVVVRTYDHERNAELVKKRALGSIASFNLYHKGENFQSSEQDLIDFITSLNDNDIFNMDRLKHKKMKRADYSSPLAFQNIDAEDRYIIIDKLSGEILNTDYKTDTGGCKDENGTIEDNA